MIGIATKHGEKGEVSMTRGFAIGQDANDIVSFINGVSEKTSGAVARADALEIKEQISTAAVVARSMEDNSILAYNGSSLIGTGNGMPVIEIKSGVVADEFVGRALNGDSKAIIIDSIREKHPHAVLVAVKTEAELRKGKAASLKEMGFVSDREADTIESHRNSEIMKELKLSEKFWESASARAAGGRIWIGVQTKETYDNQGVFKASEQNEGLKSAMRDAGINGQHSRSCLP